MIDELNGEPIHVCVCWSRKSPHHLAHCLELDLIGEGQTKTKARSSLKELIKIQCRVCEENGLDLRQTDGYYQWKEYHDNAQYSERDSLVVQLHGASEGQSDILHMEIDNRTRCIRNCNDNSWPSECSLSDVEVILRDNGVCFRRVSEKPQYGYFFGPWGAESEGPLQSYPLYLPDGIHIRWYHLQGIFSRFGLEDFRSRLACDNENIES